jgi:hypothetical protein
MNIAAASQLVNSDVEARNSAPKKRKKLVKKVAAGGPGSGPRPGQGRESALLNKYADFMVRHNPNITDATQHYEQMAKFFDKLGGGSKNTMHKFFDTAKQVGGIFKPDVQPKVGGDFYPP